MIATDYSDSAPAGWSSASFPELPSGWSLTTGLSDAVTTATNLFGAAAGVVSSIDNYKYTQSQRQLDLLKQSSAIDLQRTYTQAQVDISKAQAQAAVRRAQENASIGEFDSVNGYASNLGQDFSAILGNINSRIAGNGNGSGSNLMLWLTVAGVGIAVMQYAKSRK